MLVPHQKLLPVKTRLQRESWGVHEQVRAIGYGQSKVKGRQEWQGSSEDVRWALPHVQELCDLVHLFQLYRCTIYSWNGVKCWNVVADFGGFPFPSRKHLAGNVGKYVAVFDAGQLNIAYPSKAILKFVQMPRSCMECRLWLLINDFAVILNHIMPVFCKDKVFAFDHGSTSKRSDHGNILWKFVGSRHVPSTPFTFILDYNYWSHSACVRPKGLKKLGLSRYSALTTIRTGAAHGMATSMTSFSTVCLATPATWWWSACWSCNKWWAVETHQPWRVILYRWQTTLVNMTLRSLSSPKFLIFIQEKKCNGFTRIWPPWVLTPYVPKFQEYLKRVSLKRNPEPFTFCFAGRTPSRVAELRDREFAGTQWLGHVMLRCLQKILATYILYIYISQCLHWGENQEIPCNGQILFGQKSPRPGW